MLTILEEIRDELMEQGGCRNSADFMLHWLGTSTSYMSNQRRGATPTFHNIFMLHERLRSHRQNKLADKLLAAMRADAARRWAEHDERTNG
jgi:hypothetical protein